ncbi:hypothetical protein [Mycobacterium sp. 852002-51961_SCH5331710]|uniref:hypothetical protein n=1 Tax=Mycobacterium sp. 852002-51961_SCH5331710 TaxID=1834105 RepID=UPI0007FD8D78|nr:hypothetical protein [Mycobacterium sp. 852002-51961_SCH5331710]OBB34946.1 hypothetical protein A5752_20470 [Mycobacterium sp. 852002-51961_SCH5331710]
MTSADRIPHLSRRAALGALGLGAAAIATAPQAAGQLDQGYEAMLMKCIDPRFTTSTWKYMTGRGWQNNYSEFAFAGGPVGVVAPAFAGWHETFWENLAISVDLHWLTRLIGMAHRDCGAAAAAYGDRVLTDRAYETEVLSGALRAFRDEAGRRQPALVVELGIMDLDGTVEVVT